MSRENKLFKKEFNKPSSKYSNSIDFGAENASAEKIPEDKRIRHTLDYYFTRGIGLLTPEDMKKEFSKDIFDEKVFYDHKGKCIYSSLVTLIKKKLIKDRSVRSIADFEKINDTFQYIKLSNNDGETIDILKSLSDREYALYGRYNRFNPMNMKSPDLTYIDLIFREQSSRISKGKQAYEIIDYGQIRKNVIDSFIKEHSKLYKKGLNGYKN